jgi:hypothetical protein
VVGQEAVEYRPAEVDRIVVEIFGAGPVDDPRRSGHELIVPAGLGTAMGQTPVQLDSPCIA